MKSTKVSSCCGVPVVKATPPFTSTLCPECVNMTTGVTPAQFAALQEERAKMKGGSAASR